MLSPSLALGEVDVTLAAEMTIGVDGIHSDYIGPVRELGHNRTCRRRLTGAPARDTRHAALLDAEHL
jgi:hypothetical protein